MEHKLIQGGEEYLPFARSRIRALKASGQTYATQRISMPDGAMVSVRLAGEHEYIEISGSTGNLYLVFWEPAAGESYSTSAWTDGYKHKHRTSIFKKGKYHIVKTVVPDCKVFKYDRAISASKADFDYTYYFIDAFVDAKPVMTKEVRVGQTLTKTRFLGKDGESPGSVSYAAWDIAVGFSDVAAVKVPTGRKAGLADIGLVNARLPAQGSGADNTVNEPFVRENLDFGLNTVSLFLPDGNGVNERNVVRACGSSSFLAGTLDADFNEVLNVVRYNGAVRIRTTESEFAARGDFPEHHYKAFRFFDDYIVTVRGGDSTGPGAFSINCFNINDKSHKTVNKKVFENLIPQGCYLVGVHRDELATMQHYSPTP
jgi:hypothetical protein